MNTLEKALKKKSSEADSGLEKKQSVDSAMKEKADLFKSPQIGGNWSQVLGLSSKLSEKLEQFELNEDKKEETFFIGVCGGTCAGKKNIVQLIQQELKDVPIAVLSQENFYKNFANQEGFDINKIDWDTPSSTDWDLLHVILEFLNESKQ